MKKYIFAYTGYNELNQVVFGQSWVDAENREIAYNAVVNWVNEQGYTNITVSQKALIGEVNCVTEEVLPEDKVTVFSNLPNLDADLVWIINRGLGWVDNKRREFSQRACNEYLKVGGYSTGRTLN